MIAKFAEVLRNSIPAGNFIGRSGGDEFISIIYNTDEERVKKDHCRYAGTDHCIQSGKRTRCMAAGSSGGLCLCERGGQPFYTALYELADKRMYENKRAMKAVRTE